MQIVKNVYLGRSINFKFQHTNKFATFLFAPNPGKCAPGNASSPGHIKGACSYLFDVKDEKRIYRVLIANMPSIIIDRKFSDVKAYPNIANDYAYTLSHMKKLSFDIWLASHASQFNLQPRDAYNPMAFIDRAGYDAALAKLQNDYDKKIKEEED